MTEIALVIAILAAAGALIGLAVQKNNLTTSQSQIRSLEKDLKDSEDALESHQQNIGQLQLAQSNLSGEVDQLKGQKTALKEELTRLSDALLTRERELSESRLEKLNYELSPHAFKNTLNTIKGMAYRMNLATEKFTDLLNYMLYETKKKQVTLEEELKFIGQYLALNELMIPPWVNISTDFDAIDPNFAARTAIAPMVSIYFAENAFKHARTDGKDCFIKFSIQRDGPDKIIYSVSNKRHLNKPSPKQSGVGSVNLKQRLELLYPGRYSVESYTAEDIFVASLTLTLEPYENQMPVGG
jgi:sensor histidine kinase YesM